MTGSDTPSWSIRLRAVSQAIETIRNRIDQLGVSEPVIQEHGLGQYQILVQLPGVDDPARVKEIMQSTAMLEIRQALGGPYPSEQAALQEHGGVLPPDAVLMKGKNNPTFLISWRSQRDLARSLGWKCSVMIWGGPALALLSLYALINLMHWL